ncbi:MAG: putative porin [Proteobacteria bacterium]|nr:putative porin [Burkholderiales bacterium]
MAVSLCFAPIEALVPIALAQEREELEALRQTTVRLIELLVKEGILSQQRADELVKQARQPVPVASADAKPGVPPVRVQYVPEIVRQQLRDEIRQEVLATAKKEGWVAPNILPDWVNRITFEGDIRLRSQSEFYPDDNDPLFQPLNVIQSNQQGRPVFPAATPDRQRLRARVRLGATAQITDQWQTGIRIATGSSTEPVSQNQTFGENFNRYTIGLDRAFLSYRPAERVEIVGGRMANPFFSTDLMFANDLSVDGVMVRYQPASTTMGFAPLANIGAFPVQEVSASSGGDKWMFAGQAGVQWRSEGFRARVAGALYDYQNLEGRPNTVGSTANNFTAPGFTQKGNSIFNINSADPTAAVLYGYASEFRIANLNAELDWAFMGSTRVVLSADYVRNLGFDQQEIRNRTGLDISPQIDGYRLGISVGHSRMSRAHDWQVFTTYKRVERDAVVDAFTDSDFRLGGTNAKGFTLGGSYGFANNLWLTVRWLSANGIDAPIVASLPNVPPKFGADVLQVDLNARF